MDNKNDCTLCELRSNQDRLPVWGRNLTDHVFPHKHHPLVFIEDFPTKHCVDRSMALIGREGKYLSNLIKDVIDTPKKIFVTYAVKCCLGDRDKPLIRHFIPCTLNNLKLELDITEPKYIVNFGGLYFEYLFRKEKLKAKDYYGRWLESDIYQITTAPSLNKLNKNNELMVKVVKLLSKLTL